MMERLRVKEGQEEADKPLTSSPGMQDKKGGFPNCVTRKVTKSSGPKWQVK